MLEEKNSKNSKPSIAERIGTLFSKDCVSKKPISFIEICNNLGCVHEKNKERDEIMWKFDDDSYITIKSVVFVTYPENLSILKPCIAKKIVQIFDSYGYITENFTLDQICSKIAIREEFDKHIKYIFPDMSVITVLMGEWDFGYRNCWCRKSTGHLPTCDNKEEK